MIDIVERLEQCGITLSIEAGQVVIDRPEGDLPEGAADLLEEARAHRDEIRKYLEQVSPGEVRTVEPTTKRTCYFCGGTRFWISVYGMTICTRCHPPAAPHLVADWLGEDPEHAGRPPEVVH